MEKTNKFGRRGKSTNPNKMRNLAQYKDMTDEDFDKLVESQSLAAGTSKKFEDRIEEKLAKFSDDYDLTDLKINDREILRALIQAIIALEDYEQILFTIRDEGINPDNLLVIDKIQKAQSDLRKDISNFQNDLAITRKHRKSDQEQSVIAYIDSLKDKAKKFYQSKMSYIFCPKCTTLLMTEWSLFPEQKNKIELICIQKDKDGNPCGTKVVVTTDELIRSRSTNNVEAIPESLT